MHDNSLVAGKKEVRACAMYLSPESVSGLSSSDNENLDMAVVDMWSLGCILAEMFIGFCPFDSDPDASECGSSSDTPTASKSQSQSDPLTDSECLPGEKAAAACHHEWVSMLPMLVRSVPVMRLHRTVQFAIMNGSECVPCLFNLCQ